MQVSSINANIGGGDHPLHFLTVTRCYRTHSVSVITETQFLLLLALDLKKIIRIMYTQTVESSFSHVSKLFFNQH